MALRDTELPAQMVAEAGLIKIGPVFTFIITVCVAKQPKVLSPVTVYVVVTVGVAVIVAPLLEFNEVEDIHTYELAPSAVKETELPGLIVVAEAVMLTEGAGLTVITKEPVFEHPFISTPVTE